MKLNLIIKIQRSKQPIYLNQVEISKIAISDQFKLDDGVKNFIGYKNGETVTLLCIISPQMSEIIKYLKNKKSHVILADDDDVILKHNEIWRKSKKLLSVEFDSQPIMMKIH